MLTGESISKFNTGECLSHCIPARYSVIFFFDYNQNRDLLRSGVIKDDSLYISEENSYNEKGFIIKKVANLKQYYYEYNQIDLLITAKCGSNGELHSTESYEYNSLKQLVKSTIVFTEGNGGHMSKVITEYIYTYF